MNKLFERLLERWETGDLDIELSTLIGIILAIVAAIYVLLHFYLPTLPAHLQHDLLQAKSNV